MRYIFLSILLVFIHGSMVAQWSKLPVNTSANFSKICFSSVASGYAITDRAVMQTVDSGKTWNMLRLGFSAYLMDLFVVNDSTAWVAGGNFPYGFVARTNNYGKDWSMQRTPLKQIYSVYFLDAANGWALGNDNSGHSIYHTIDGGITWTSQRDGNDYVRSVYFNSATHGWVAGDNGQIYTTVDAGMHWVERDPNVVFHFKSIMALTDSSAYVVGAYQYGGCYRTVDGGLNWEEQDLPSLAHLHAVQFTSVKTGWIAGDRGTILQTTDGGKHWYQETTNTRSDLSTIYMTESGFGFAAGKYGTILKRVQ